MPPVMASPDIESGTISETWQSSQYRPPISSGGATIPAQTEVGAPCGIVFHRNGALPSPVSCRFRCSIYLTRINVTGQFGLYHSWMHSGSADRTIAVPFVECNREENVRRLRPPIGNPRFVACVLEIGIVEVDVRVGGVPEKTS